MQYMVRIELHHADDDTYERLHSTAAAVALSRILTDSSTGAQYHAPTGTYWTDRYATWQEVMSAAQRAARAVQSSFEIMVAGDGNTYFFNCPPVQRKPSPGAVALALGGPRGLAPRKTLLTAPTMPVPSGLRIDPPSSLEIAFEKSLLGLK